MARALALGLALAVIAPNAVAEPPVLEGVIAHVDKEHARLHVVAPNGQEAWVACGHETVVTIRGYAASSDDLRPDFRVKVTVDPETGVATRIDAHPPSGD